MNEQQEFYFAVLSFWYKRAELRNDRIAMASYNRKIFKLMQLAYPWYKALPETVKGE